MDTAFWHERWKAGQIAFHRQEVNPQLVAFWDRLGLAPGGRVLVPLCGKSLDMLWLRERGFGVLGVEVSELAVESFFAENNLPVRKRQAGAFTAYDGERLTLLCGNFFDLGAEVVAGGCAAVYDRASLIALPPDMRRRYARHLLGLFPDGLNSLLLTLEYPQQEMDGPPFSVGMPELQSLYGGNCTVERLLAHDVLGNYPGFRDKGLTRLEEKVYRLSPNQTD